ncbi:hypothetical protein FRC08_017556, partial [Ceratobasidium sp. 394]
DCTNGGNCWARRITEEDLLRHFACLPPAGPSPPSLGTETTREARASPVPILPVPIAPSQPSPTPSPPPQQESKTLLPQDTRKDHTIDEEVVTYSQTLEPSTDEQPNVVNVNIVTPSNLATPNPAPAPVPACDPSGDEALEELNKRYTEAQVEISQLQGLLVSVPPKDGQYQGVGDGGNTVVDQVGKGWTMVELDPMTVQQSEGVPLQMVMPIALGVFATTYLLF